MFPLRMTNMPPIEKTEKPTEKLRKFVYPVALVEKATGDDAITVEKAKSIMGWEEETDQIKFGGDFLLRDEYGTKIRCKNNANNRPFDEGWARRLAQDVLGRHFKFNFETIVIGWYGSVLSGQHRLVALILAAQIRERDETGMWKKKWPTEPVLESLIGYGCSEDPEVVRTLDNVKPRSFSDVLFTSGLFGNMIKKDRKVVCKITDFAIKTLWDRTGAKKDAYAPRRTHSEGLEFLHRHKKIVDSVKHIWEENKSGSLSKLGLGSGRSAGTLYLMGCSQSDAAEYGDTRSESSLNWELWDTACTFWTLLGSGAKDLHDLITALKKLLPTQDHPGGSADEKFALIAKAWVLFADNKPVTKDKLKVKVNLDEDGHRFLDENPTVGGIDLGNDMEDIEKGDKGANHLPTEEEIKKEKTKIKDEHIENGKEKPKEVKDDVVIDARKDKVAKVMEKLKEEKKKNPRPKPKAVKS